MNVVGGEVLSSDGHHKTEDESELNFKGSNPANKRLVKRAMRGNTEAINRVIDLYYQDILYFAIKKVGRQEGEDVTQQAIADIIDNLEKLKDPSKLKSWMMTIAHHKCVDHMKRNKRTTNMITPEDDFGDEMLSIEDEDREFLPEQALMDAQQQEMVLSIIDTLPENYADCLRLHYHNGLSYKEIADVLGVDIKKVKNDMYRGLALFKKRYEERAESKYHYGAAVVGAVPLLTQAFEADCAEVITSDMSNRILRAAYQYSAAKGTGTLVAGNVGKIVAGSLAGLAIIGVTATVLLNMSSEETTPAAPVEEVAQQEPETTTAQEREILTIADMIGEDEAALLASFEAGAVDTESWNAFIERIGAEVERTGLEPNHTYTVYLLEKQDKQLILADRVSADGMIEVRSIFRPIEELPLMTEVILMFP